MLAGVGFTVSLLIGELAYGVGSATDEHVKVGVLVGSLVSAVAAAVVLRARNRRYRAIEELRAPRRRRRRDPRRRSSEAVSLRGRRLGCDPGHK